MSNSISSLTKIEEMITKKNNQFNGITSNTISKFSHESSSVNITQNQSEIKGSTKTFKFIVPYTNAYEPLIIRLYENSDEEIFVKNIYLEKRQLINEYANSIRSVHSKDIFNKNFLSQ